MTDNYDPNSIFGAYKVPRTNINTDYGPTTAPPSTAGWSMGEAGPIGSSVAPASAYNPPNMGDPGGTDWVSVLAQRRRNIMRQQQGGGAASQMVMNQASQQPQGMSAISDPSRTPEEIARQQAFIAGGGWDPSHFATAPPGGPPPGAIIPNETGTGMPNGPPPPLPNNPAAYGTAAPPAAGGAQMPYRYGTTPWQQTTTINGQPYGAAEQNQWAGWGGVAGGPAQPGGYTTGPFPGAPQGGGAGNAVPPPAAPPPAAVAPPAAGGGLTPEQGSQQTYTAVKQHLMQLLASGNAAQAQQLISSIRGY